jgi:hypothetical protein
MAKEISDQDIITGLQALKSSLWKTLLEKQPFSLNNISALIQNPQYMVAHRQRAQNSDPIGDDWQDKGPSDDWEDKNTSILYYRINKIAEAIPAIQEMQDVKEWGISVVTTKFNSFSPEIQESVAYVLKRARSKLDDANQQYATFGEISGERLTEEQKESNRTLQGQLRDLLTLLPATSTGAKGSPIQIVRAISGDSRATKPEEASRQSDGVLDGMRRIAEQAAGAFGGAVQKFQHLIGISRDHTQ